MTAFVVKGEIPLWSYNHQIQPFLQIKKLQGLLWLGCAPYHFQKYRKKKLLSTGVLVSHIWTTLGMMKYIISKCWHVNSVVVKVIVFEDEATRSRGRVQGHIHQGQGCTVRDPSCQVKLIIFMIIYQPDTFQKCSVNVMFQIHFCFIPLQVKYTTNAPVWEEMTHFFVKKPQIQSLDVEVGIQNF